MSLGFVIKVESGISPSSRFSPRRGSYKRGLGTVRAIFHRSLTGDSAHIPRLQINQVPLLILFILLQLRSDKKVPFYFIKFVTTIRGLCLHLRQTMRVSFRSVSDAYPHSKHSSLYIGSLLTCSACASPFFLKSQLFKHIFQLLIFDLPLNHPTDS